MTVMPIHPHLSYLGDHLGCRLLMQVPDIEGSSTMAEYEGWIPVDAMSATWVLSNDDTAGRGRRRRTITPGRVVLRLGFDSAGLYLVRAAFQGRSFDQVELHHVVVGDEVRTPLKQVFDNVVVEAARTDSVGALPVLQVEVSYEDVRMTWTDLDPDGTAGPEHEVQWDVASGPG